MFIVIGNNTEICDTLLTKVASQLEKTPRLKNLFLRFYKYFIILSSGKLIKLFYHIILKGVIHKLRGQVLGGGGYMTWFMDGPKGVLKDLKVK